jgi:phage terminase small subunit
MVEKKEKKKRTRKLTSQQELFAARIAAGDKLADACLAAYPRAAGWTPATVLARAYRVANTPSVAARIKELRDQMIEPALADGRERRRWWMRVMEDETASTRDRLKASELLARACGDFIERREVSGPDGGPLMILVDTPRRPTLDEWVRVSREPATPIERVPDDDDDDSN